MILGLITATSRIFLSGELGSVLYTKTRRLSPTCGAESPTPLESYRIVNISSHSFASLSSKSVTGLPTSLSTGLGNSMTVKVVSVKVSGLA